VRKPIDTDHLKLFRTTLSLPHYLQSPTWQDE
jgi:hypothetical protein